MFVFTATRPAAGAIGPAAGDEITHAREATQQTVCERLPYAQRGASGAGPGVEATDPPRWSGEPIASEMSLCCSRSGLELVAGVNGEAGGRSRLLGRNPREIPAAPGSVRHGSVSRARLLWAAALLLEAIATETPGNPDASVLPLEHGLALAELDRVLLPALARVRLGLPECCTRHGSAGAVLASAVTSLSGHASGSPPPGEQAWPVEPLTSSETRVLHYLPTYMGAPEIAAALCLSANTVKTHVRHLYRKLGVHSRREAVQRARALGLLAAKASHPTSGQPRSAGNGGMDHVIRAR
jgi:DNA-binding CsgD family transcriptional regulator